MEQVARWCTVALAAVTAGGVLAAPAVTPELPDVQVGAADLAANVSDLNGSEFGIFQDLFQHVFPGFAPDVSIDSDVVPPGLEEITALGGGDGGLGNADLSDLTQGLDTDALNGALAEIGEALHPTGDEVPTFLAPVPGLFDGGFDGSGATGMIGVNDQGATAANAAAAVTASAWPGLQAAYQSMTSGLVDAEMAFNKALVEAQSDAVDKLLDSGNANGDFANFMFNVSNMALAHSEEQLNNMLGASFDSSSIESSLLTNFDPDALAQEQWATLLGLSPADFTDLIHAVQADSFSLLLADLFPGVF